jgi:exodeoxyribonuclease V alpha subunit
MYFRDDRVVKCDFSDLDQPTLAYAITIHKSQGSEYSVVIIPLLVQYYMMLRLNLIYTEVTRGKKLVILIGEKKALSIAINDKKNFIRYSRVCLFNCVNSDMGR